MKKSIKKQDTFTLFPLAQKTFRVLAELDGMTFVEEVKKDRCPYKRKVEIKNEKTND